MGRSTKNGPFLGLKIRPEKWFGGCQVAVFALYKNVGPQGCCIWDVSRWGFQLLWLRGCGGAAFALYEKWSCNLERPDWTTRGSKSPHVRLALGATPGAKFGRIRASYGGEGSMLL